MKLYFEPAKKLYEGNLDLSFEAKDIIKHKVYNALSDIAFKYRHVDPKVLQDVMEDALDWWEDRFWDFDWEYDEFEECLVEEVDLQNKPHTIAYELAQPENYTKFVNIVDSSTSDWKEARRKMIELLGELDVSENTIKKQQSNLMKANSQPWFLSTLGTLWTGVKTIQTNKKPTFA